MTTSSEIVGSGESHKPAKSPECGSHKVFRNGTAHSNFDVKIQRYVCRACGRRFSSADDLTKAKEVADSYLPPDLKS